MVQMTCLFWWRTAQTSFESGLHFTRRSQKLWSSCCVKGADTESSRQVRSTSASCYLSLRRSGSPRTSFCLWWTAQDVDLVHSGVTANFRSHSITALAVNSAIKAEISQEVQSVTDQHKPDLNSFLFWISLKCSLGWTHTRANVKQDKRVHSQAM